MRLVLVLLAALLFVSSPARAQEACAGCHETPSAAAMAESVHGFLECVSCHGGAAEFPHAEGAAKVDCATCHDTAVEELTNSAHGRARDSEAHDGPDCASCHGEIHTLRGHTDPASPLHVTKLAATCGGCHASPEMVEHHGKRFARPVEAYLQSVHARQAAAGVHAATCSDCHGSHAVLPPSNPASKVAPTQVVNTCGSCHAEIAAAFSRSVHGIAAARGVRQAPLCTDCHGEHRILSPEERGSPVFASNIPLMTCGRCHEDLRVSDRTGLSPETVRAYSDSYHGLATRSGSVTVANCSSCHGVHEILPSSDPQSPVHPDNLAATCGGCHPGAGQRYAIGAVHVLADAPSHPVVHWARWGYLWLIWLSVGGMVVHNLLDLASKVRAGHHRQPLLASTSLPDEERMTLGFRLAHGLLIVSFALLVWTGFALKYPDGFWARPLLQWEDALGLRGGLHRVAAVALLLALGLHLAHLWVDRRARACIAAMRPRREDLHELVGRLAWYLGRRPTPPPTPRLGYVEKFEYLALMWGIVVMAVTGFALWFENFTLRWAPKWISDLATTIHFYEAVLATLAIIVWHFYFVIFDPLVYPMDSAWWTGRSAPGRAAERSEAEPSPIEPLPPEPTAKDGAGEPSREDGPASPSDPRPS